MSNRFIFKFAVTVAVVASITNRTEAKTDPFMEVGKITSIPIGHYEFCNQNPDECSTATKGDVRVKLTKANWETLLDVNNQANQLIEAVTDADLYGTEEYWAYPTYAGDCEDYVLKKRQALMAQGWPPSALLITVVLQPNGEGHAVLTVRTDRGDLVLDNLDDRVMLWSETPYTYIKRQSKNHTGKWELIKDGRVNAVGSIGQ